MSSLVEQRIRPILDRIKTRINDFEFRCEAIEVVLNARTYIGKEVPVSKVDHVNGYSNQLKLALEETKRLNNDLRQIENWISRPFNEKILSMIFNDLHAYATCLDEKVDIELEQPYKIIDSLERVLEIHLDKETISRF